MSPRNAIRIAIITLAGLVAGTAIAGGKAPPPPPVEPASPATPGPAYRADEIVENWEDVRAMAHDIYLARAEKVPRPEPGGFHDWCFERMGTGQEPARRLCAPPWETFGSITEREGCGDGPIHAWLVTVDDGGREKPLAVQGACATPEELPELSTFHDPFVHAIRCGQIDRVWGRIPVADRACKRNTDCTVLQAGAGCFNQPLAKAFAAPFQEVLDHHGPGCEYAIMGMCPSRDIVPECRKGVCNILGDPYF